MNESWSEEELLEEKYIVRKVKNSKARTVGALGVQSVTVSAFSLEAETRKKPVSQSSGLLRVHTHAPRQG